MKPWKIILIPTAIMLVIAAIYIWHVSSKRKNPGVVKQGEEQPLTQDDVAVVRMEFPAHFEDVKDLAGKSVWMKNGYTMPYFAYTGGKVDFKKKVGVVPPLEKLDVKKAVEASVPKDVDDGISHGQKQALVVFTMKGDEKQEYATPVGARDGGTEQYYDDLLFFYDDPHKIYTHWPADVWSAVDQHQVKQGMNELQARLALGQKIQTDDPKTEGNRTVTFRNDKATDVKQGT